jgi:hypothetical protein
MEDVLLNHSPSTNSRKPFAMQASLLLLHRGKPIRVSPPLHGNSIQLFLIAAKTKFLCCDANTATANFPL